MIAKWTSRIEEKAADIFSRFRSPKIVAETGATAWQGRAAAEQRALRDAERRKGGQLTDDETMLVKKLSELNWNVNSPQAGQSGDLAVKTNSLTARGGFQGGAAIPDSEKIAREVCDYSRRQAETAEKIMRLLEEMGRD